MSHTEDSGIGLLLAAASFAAERHRDQRRKGEGSAPYINHPIEVARILAQDGGVTDTEILCAALLHDTVEDTDTSIDEIVERFGSVIAGYVSEVTDDKALPKAERKRLQVEHAPHKSPGAKTIKLADKISNLRDIAKDPPPDWTSERRRNYGEWAIEVGRGLRGANPLLETLFDAAAAAVLEKHA